MASPCCWRLRRRLVAGYTDSGRPEISGLLSAIAFVWAYERVLNRRHSE
jgi:hypothetical protein